MAKLKIAVAFTMALATAGCIGEGGLDGTYKKQSGLFPIEELVISGSKVTVRGQREGVGKIAVEGGAGTITVNNETVKFTVADDCITLNAGGGMVFCKVD